MNNNKTEYYLNFKISTVKDIVNEKEYAIQLMKAAARLIIENKLSKLRKNNFAPK